MDQFTADHCFWRPAGKVDGVASVGCSSRHSRATLVRSTSDPTRSTLQVHQWQPIYGYWSDRNRVHPLRSTVPSFVERLIGTLRREYLDHTLFWTTADLKTSCSISGLPSTTIARIPPRKGERRIRPRHDQQPISLVLWATTLSGPLSDTEAA